MRYYIANTDNPYVTRFEQVHPDEIVDDNFYTEEELVDLGVDDFLLRQEHLTKIKRAIELAIGDIAEGKKSIKIDNLLCCAIDCSWDAIYFIKENGWRKSGDRLYKGPAEQRGVTKREYATLRWRAQQFFDDAIKFDKRHPVKCTEAIKKLMTWDEVINIRDTYHEDKHPDWEVWLKMLWDDPTLAK